MLTGRGWLLFVVTVLLTGIGLAVGNPLLVMVGGTLLSWFLAGWLWFAARIRLLNGKFDVERRVTNQHGPAECLWAGTRFTVEVQLVNASRWQLPFVFMVERVPPLAAILRGSVEASGPVARDQPLELRYEARCGTAGRVCFDGVQATICDLQGFFVHTIFVRDGRTLRVLPPLVDARGRPAGVKRHNQLPLLGHHAHRRPGTGSELLDLRDYLPGDPPKTIAWKASARRDRLMTKEFESEVPIRCTLFVDKSQSVRVGGPGNNALARLVEIAATVAQANAARRDLTGLCLFDEQGVDYHRPGRGARHLVQMMQRLAEAASAMPSARDVPVNRLLPLAYGLAQDIYPEFLEPQNNVFPFWLPLWSPHPAYAMRRPSRLARSLLAKPLHWVWQRLSPAAHRDYRWRKQLAAFLSVRYGLAPAGLAILLEDDEIFARYLQRFLGEHQLSPPAEYYDSRGRYQYASPEKIDVLSRTFLRAVGKGHDNELFVLLADLLEAEDGLEKLLTAVKVALARHHQVLVLCPWPAAFPLPPQSRGPGREKDTRLPAELERFSRYRTVQAMVRRATVLRLHRAFFQMRDSFARLGVQVLCAGEDDSVELILKRLDRLRTLERGVS